MRFIRFLALALLPAMSLSNLLQAIRDASPDATAELNLRAKAISILARDAEAEAVGISKRATCDIIHVATTVRCMLYPSHRFVGGNRLIKEIPGTTNNIEFDCFAKCQVVHGISTWFWTPDYGSEGCYVPGYYLDNNCVSSGSGASPRCSWATSDENKVGC